MQPSPLRSPMPVRSSRDALTLLSLAVCHPLEHETLAFLLDADGIGGQMMVVADTEPPEAVVHVVDFMAQLGARLPGFCSLVVATMRPEGGLLAGDVDRWLEASSIAHDHGILLVEWYVVGPLGIECPRDLLGEPERWPVHG